MLRAIILTIVAGLICMGGASCKKFLAASSQNDFTPQTTESYSELLFGTGYPQASDGVERAIPYMDDDVQVYSGSQNFAQVAAEILPAYAWQPDFFQQMVGNGLISQANLDGYNNCYSRIVGANIAIQYADGSIGTQADKDYLKGQAFALRAYYYFMLVNLYGRPYNDSTIDPANSPGLPLILSPNLSTDLPTRNSVAQVYQQITTDLDSAFVRLDGAQQKGDVYRLNHISTHLLASRVWLYMGGWDSVISNANYVLRFQPQLMNLNSWGVNSGWTYASGTFLPIIGLGNVETIWTFGNTSEIYPVDGAGCTGMSSDLVAQYDSSDRGPKYTFQSCHRSYWLGSMFPTRMMNFHPAPLLHQII